MPVTAEMITDIFTTAHEGGCSHWAYMRRTGDTVMTFEPTDDEHDEFEKVTVTAPMVREALGVVRKKYPETYTAGMLKDAIRESDSSYLDAEAADVIMQTAALGKIVYG